MKRVTLAEFIKQLTQGVGNYDDEIMSIGTWSGKTPHKFEIHCVDAEGNEYPIFIDYGEAK